MKNQTNYSENDKNRFFNITSLMVILLMIFGLGLMAVNLFSSKQKNKSNTELKK